MDVSLNETFEGLFNIQEGKKLKFLFTFDGTAVCHYRCWYFLSASSNFTVLLSSTIMTSDFAICQISCECSTGVVFCWSKPQLIVQCANLQTHLQFLVLQIKRCVLVPTWEAFLVVETTRLVFFSSMVTKLCFLASLWLVRPALPQQIRRLYCDINLWTTIHHSKAKKVHFFWDIGLECFGTCLHCTFKLIYSL